MLLDIQIFALCFKNPFYFQQNDLIENSTAESEHWEGLWRMFLGRKGQKQTYLLHSRN